MTDPAHRWLQRLTRGDGPIYLSLVEALAGAVRDGELQAGDQLPPQRTVAGLLGIDFTTVTRAYAEARARGLVEAVVGRGTFVRARAADDEAGVVDLSMNLPPPPDGVSLGGLIKETVQSILGAADASLLMAYHPGGGTQGQKTAGAAWLEPCLGPVDPGRLLVCPGAQTGLAAILSAVAGPGDTVIVEPLTYPGLKDLAARLGLALAACPVDADGVLPEALTRLCAERRPAAVYLVPTMQNPTAGTMPAGRRAEVAQVVRAADTWLIEDDPYSRLVDVPLPALASLAPERTFHLATVSKCLSPGLRTAFLATPGEAVQARVIDGLRAFSLMGSPLMTAVVARWIREGAAGSLLEGVKREARARREIAARLLPAARGAAESLHVWLDLPASRDISGLHAMAQQRGLSLVTADAFAVEGAARAGLRVSLGGPARRGVLEQGLKSLAGLLAG
jgi:DNA-binding transcriptional MocR family regulator